MPASDALKCPVVDGQLRRCRFPRNSGLRAEPDEVARRQRSGTVPGFRRHAAKQRSASLTGAQLLLDRFCSLSSWCGAVVLRVSIAANGLLRGEGAEIATLARAAR
jgi:hypothetical protein